MICTRLDRCVEEMRSGKKSSSCDNNKKQCILSSDKRSEIKCEEKKKKYILKNSQSNHVIAYQVDGGIVATDASVPEGTQKCDFLFVVDAKEFTAILIELKGVDVPKALKQIQGTLELYRGFWNKFSHVYGRIIVTSSTPNLKASPAYVNLAGMLRKNFHGNIKIVKRQFTEKDTELGKEP